MFTERFAAGHSSWVKPMIRHRFAGRAARIAGNQAMAYESPITTATWAEDAVLPNVQVSNLRALLHPCH